MENKPANVDLDDPKVVDAINHCAMCGKDLLNCNPDDCEYDPETDEYLFPIAIVPYEDGSVEVYCQACYDKLQC